MQAKTNINKTYYKKYKHFIYLAYINMNYAQDVTIFYNNLF